jgi:alpha-galactosidase
MLIHQDELQKLLDTGWQSWSFTNPNTKGKKFFPCLYPPQKATVPTLLTTDLKKKKPVKGWCSFYAFGTDITQQKIFQQIKTLQQQKLTSFQYILLDDGWTPWGDWLSYDKQKFPKGLSSLTKAIRKEGFQPGIWIAPFLVSPNATLVQQHPEWLVKDTNGNYKEGLQLLPGNNYLPFKRYILDIKNPKVLQYIDNTLSWLLEECKFSLIKLDWLYSIYYTPHTSIIESDMFLRSFLLTIKKKYPQVYTIGCGCPLIPAIGTVDSMRIAPDILIPRVQKIPFIKDLTNRYLHKKILGNAEKRMWTKKYWNLDLDAFCCRPSLGLSYSALEILQKMIKKSEGNIFLGDDMTTLHSERIKRFIQPLA